MQRYTGRDQAEILGDLGEWCEQGIGKTGERDHIQ